MKTPRLLLLAGWAAVAALLLTGCASDATPAPAPKTASAATSPELTSSTAAVAVAKLTKNLTSAQVRSLLGAPAAIKPLSANGARGETWSYTFSGVTGTRLVPIATQEVPATNPLTGQSINRLEPVYQNQDVQTVDTLYLLLINDALVEWRVVRDETKKFQ